MNAVRAVKYDLIMIKRSVIFLFLAAAAFAQSGFHIVEQGKSSIMLEYTSPELTWEQVTVDHSTFALPALGNLPLLQHPGKPQLPVAAFRLPVFADSCTVTVIDSVVSVQNITAVCPAPTWKIAAPNQLPVLTYPTEHQIPPGRFFPSHTAAVRSAILRDQKRWRLAVYPLRYSPAAGSVRHYRYLKLKVTILPRRTSKTKKPHIHTVTAAPGQLKVLCAADGVYKMTGADLQTMGLNPGDIQPHTLKLHHRTEQVPLLLTGVEDGVFDTGDELLFYGRRRRDGAEFYSDWSDTTVYMLTWGGEKGQRYRPVVSVSAPQTYPVTFATLHLEQDLDYHEGDTDEEIQKTARVPGEGWVWYFINRGEKRRITFDLPGFVQTDDSLLVRLRLRGTTLDGAEPDHHVRITINGREIKNAYFHDRQELLLSAAAPSDFFIAAGNQLDITSVDDLGAKLSQFYLDWIEFDYSRTTRADGGTLRLRSRPEKPAGTWFVDGFSSPDIFIWDTVNNTAVVPELAGKISKKSITVKSAGISDGNMAAILIDGINVISARRGFNVVALDGETGEIADIRYFDTWASAADAENLALFLNALSPGSVVCAAIRDEGSAKLNEAVYSAFESIGSTSIRQVGLRESFAFMGRKGTGKVAEEYSPESAGPAAVSSDLFFPRGGPGEAVVFSDSLTSGELLVFETAAAKKPLLKMSKPADLFSGGNGADYIVITHRNFMHDANNLADYRAVHNNFRTWVVDVQDIYDLFNHGLKHPAAIKSFLQHAFENWPNPAPAYVLLFGDASWDPKFNQPDSRKRDFVPSYGNPVSDTWFVCFNGENDLLPDMHIGRLPVEDAAEAQSVVEKIIEYEAAPSDMWRKNFLFISGGFDFVEQSIFNRQSVYLSENYIDAFPVHGNSILINKETEGLKAGEHRQDILDAMNAGAVWTNFIGHAGSRTWDLMFYNPDIEALENGPRYSFITSMTCHTGRFAEPDTNSFGEHFVRVPDRGAVSFWGTSGWGYVAEDFLFLQRLYPIVLQDSVHVLGDAITRAKIAMWETFGASAHIQNMVLQYCLLGDPALKLVLPELPDPAVLPTGLSVAPAVPSEADSLAAVFVRVNNLGLSTRPDSVLVDLYAHHPRLGGIQIDSTAVLPVLGHSDSLTFYWPLRNMSGPVRLEVVIDAPDLIAESDEGNNRRELQVSVLSSNLELAVPVNDQMLPADRVALEVRNPQVRRADTPIFEFEIDTTLAFNSPFLQSSGPVTAQTLRTRWTPDNLFPQTVHFWRCRNAAEQAWFTTAFYAHGGPVSGWRQQHGDQFAANLLIDTRVSGHGVQLRRVPVTLYVESAGYSDGNYARIVVGRQGRVEPRRGHNVVVVDPKTGRVTADKTYDTWADSMQAESMADFINGTEAGFYVLAAIKDEGSNSMTENAYLALESIGSTRCRSVGPRDSWAIIGVKGAAPGSVREQHVAAGEGTAVVTDTLHYFPGSGQCLSAHIGPADHWHEAAWNAQVPENGALTVKVVAKNRNSAQTDTLAVARGAAGNIDLRRFDTFDYPQIQLLAELSTDDGRLTPRLADWQVTYTSVPDLATAPSLLALSADTVLVGEHIDCSLEIYNIGSTTADSVSLRFEESGPDGGRRIFAGQKLPPLPADSAVTVRQSWPSAGITGPVQLYFSVDADNIVNELSENNNTLVKPVYVLSDTSGPRLSITFDGREILDGDMVSSEPVIRIRVTDNSPTPVTDTTAVNVFLDGRRLAFSAEKNRIQLAGGGDKKSAVHITPHLSDGLHTIDAIIADASGNTNSLQISFRVVSELRLFHVLNVPNPFAFDTHFTFELSQPAHVRIKIYTVAGRLIENIDAGWCTAGFNSFYWNGRDAEGDVPANGVYIYTVLASNGDEKTEALSKIVVMR